jgi:hypothetical protein
MYVNDRLRTSWDGLGFQSQRLPDNGHDLGFASARFGTAAFFPTLANSFISRSNAPETLRQKNISRT